MVFSLKLIQHTHKLIGLLIVLLAISACSSTPSLQGLSEDQLYFQAQQALREKNYRAALTYFRRLEIDYPFGTYAQSAQLALIFAYYKTSQFALADATAERFIRLHPNHNDVDYAYYMRGVANFPEAPTYFQDVFSSDISEKSMLQAEESFLYFADLVKQKPDSIYSADATARMVYLRNLMAHHEILIANQYMDYQAYVGAIGRARYVLENFQTSTSVPDALAVLVVSYDALNMQELEEESLATLSQNYPQHPALLENGNFDFNYIQNQENQWLTWLSFGVISSSRPPGFDSREVFSNPQAEFTAP